MKILHKHKTKHKLTVSQWQPRISKHISSSTSCKYPSWNLIPNGLHFLYIEIRNLTIWTQNSFNSWNWHIGILNAALISINHSCDISVLVCLVTFVIRSLEVPGFSDAGYSAKFTRASLSDFHMDKQSLQWKHDKYVNLIQ